MAVCVPRHDHLRERSSLPNHQVEGVDNPEMSRSCAKSGVQCGTGGSGEKGDRKSARRAV
eukprot:3130655-Pleurochrysis_carterae.AAC.1